MKSFEVRWNAFICMYHRTEYTEFSFQIPHDFTETLNKNLRYHQFNIIVDSIAIESQSRLL